MKLRDKIYLVVAALAGVFLWGRCSRPRSASPVPSSGPKPAAVLPLDDKELITYNENRHVLSVITDHGITQTYSQNPSVEIRKDGTVKVNSHSLGLELKPFLGGGYSDTGRAYLGSQFFYFRQFDASIGLGWTLDNRKVALQPVLSLGYNFWSNTSINAGINPISFLPSQKPEIAVFLSVRL